MILNYYFGSRIKHICLPEAYHLSTIDERFSPQLVRPLRVRPQHTSSTRKSNRFRPVHVSSFSGITENKLQHQK